MYEKYLKILRKDLPLGESFDILERNFRIGGRRASIFFTDGLTDGQNAQLALNYLLRITEEEMAGLSKSSSFLERLPYLDSNVIEPQKSSRAGGKTGSKASGAAGGFTEDMIDDCCKQGEQKMYSGLTLLAVEGLDKLIFMDMRDYPSRSVAEPEKEKSLRGAKDGFTENVMENISMIRRRIRDNNLIAAYHSVGSVSKTDVVVMYMKDKVDKKLLKRLEDKIEGLSTHALTVGDQSLLERLLRSMGAYNKLNPFRACAIRSGPTSSPPTSPRARSRSWSTTRRP